MRHAALVDEPELAAKARERHVPDRSQSLQPFVEHLAVDINRGRRALADVDLTTRTRVLQRLQHEIGNRGVQRLLAPGTSDDHFGAGMPSSYSAPVAARRRTPAFTVSTLDDAPAQRFDPRAQQLPLTRGSLAHMQRTRNQATQRLLAVQRCGAIPHDQCPCNDNEPAQQPEAAPAAPVQRQAEGFGDQAAGGQSSTAALQRQPLPGLDDLFSEPGQPGAGALPEAGAAGPAPDGPVVPAGTSAGECPPGYTICDFLNEHISVQGQYALQRLYRRGGAECHDAIQILSAVRSGQVQGVYKADEGKPAMLAQRNGTGWWTLHEHPSSVPQGGAAFVFEGESPPMVVFKKSIADDREGLATALNDAWKASAIGGTELVASPPSMKSCEPLKKEEPPPKECPPGTQADPANPENCITPQEKKDECPPGMVPDPNNPDVCLLPKPGQIVLPCSDEEVFQAFQSAQDQCAQIKSGIDMLCQFGPDICDLAGPFSKNPIAKNICKLVDPDQVKEKECKKSRPQFYADCTVGTVIGMKSTMKCNPGSNIEIFEKYKRWPGRITS